MNAMKQRCPASGVKNKNHPYVEPVDEYGKQNPSTEIKK
jgi:hypothetical protein